MEQLNASAAVPEVSHADQDDFREILGGNTFLKFLASNVSYTNNLFHVLM